MNNIIFDGAFGTYLLSKYNYHDAPEKASLSDPALVEKIHTEYLRAGANAIKTNTFAVNPTSEHDAESLRKLIYAAARCADGAVRRFVAEGNAQAKEANLCVEKSNFSESGCSASVFSFRELPVRIFADIGPVAPSLTQAGLPAQSEITNIAEKNICGCKKAASTETAIANTQNTDSEKNADVSSTVNTIVPRSRAYFETAEIFIDFGFRDFIFETQTDAKPLREAICEIRRRVPDAFVIVSFAVGQDGYSESGQFYLSLFDEAAGYGADAVGLNCVCGPAHTLNLLTEAVSRANGRYALCAMPNAGYPSFSNGRTVYIDNPGYFAEKLSAIHSLGVEILGGCCGTEPEHIRRVSELLTGKSGRIIRTKPQQESKDTTKKSSSSAAKSDLTVASSSEFGGLHTDHVDEAQKTASGALNIEKNSIVRGFDKPFIAVELPAPTDTGIDFLLAASSEAKAAGADFVTIPDSPLGKSRANSIMTASLVRRKSGIDVIPHMTCRDRNRIAIKGDLISGNIDGITHLLAITGDSIAESERRADSVSPKNVFNLNSFKLIEFVNELNGIIFGGSPYTVCAALNITARNFDDELARAEKKLRAGAECFLTQPVFSEATLKNYLTAKKTFSDAAKIAPGIMLLGGYKNAVFLKNEVPGIDIPDEIIDRLRDKNPDETRKICVEYGCEIARKIAKNGQPDGFYIMTPLKKIDYSAALVRYIKKEIMPE